MKPQYLFKIISFFLFWLIFWGPKTYSRPSGFWRCQKNSTFWYSKSPATTEVNIKAFGARGDGVSNDDAAIVKCFAYIKSIGGGTIDFPKGVYKLDPAGNTTGEPEYVITVPPNTIINSPEAEFISTNDFCFRIQEENVVWSGGKISRGRIEIKSSHVLIRNVRIEYSWMHSFHLSGGKSNLKEIAEKNYSDIQLVNCVSYRSARHGFSIHRGAYSFKATDIPYQGNFTDIQFINCQAIEPSYASASAFTSPYDYGFGIEDCISVTNITFDHCISVKAPSCGWHVEGHVLATNVLLKDCIADSNGRSLNGYPYGFMYRSGFTFENCRGTGNAKGTFVGASAYDGGNYTFINCSEDGYSSFSYSTVTDQKSYIFNPGTNGALACSWTFLRGDASLPMKALNPQIFQYGHGVHSITDLGGNQEVKDIDYIYNKSEAYSSDTRETTVASQPVQISPGINYDITLTIKELSGNRGNAILYVQEFDKNCRLLQRQGQNFSIRNVLSEVTTGEFKRLKYVVGSEFSKATVWIRVSIVFADADTDDKSFGLSEFSIEPENNIPFVKPGIYNYEARFDPNNKVRLDWSAFAPNNTYYFTIERSDTNVNFKIIDSFTASSGGSLSPYFYFDLHPNVGVNYYRLRERDNNRNILCEEIQSIKVSNPVSKCIIYPNPFSGNNFSIRVKLLNYIVYHYNILDMSGNLLKSGVITSDDQNIETRNLPKGYYIFDLSSGPTLIFQKI